MFGLKLAYGEHLEVGHAVLDAHDLRREVGQEAGEPVVHTGVVERRAATDQQEVLLAGFEDPLGEYSLMLVSRRLALSLRPFDAAGVVAPARERLAASKNSRFFVNPKSLMVPTSMPVSVMPCDVAPLAVPCWHTLSTSPNKPALAVSAVVPLGVDAPGVAVGVVDSSRQAAVVSRRAITSAPESTAPRRRLPVPPRFKCVNTRSFLICCSTDK